MLLEKASAKPFCEMDLPSALPSDIVVILDSFRKLSSAHCTRPLNRSPRLDQKSCAHGSRDITILGLGLEQGSWGSPGCLRSVQSWEKNIPRLPGKPRANQMERPCSRDNDHLSGRHLAQATSLFETVCRRIFDPKPSYPN